jgi:prephenate dehydrogenase
MNPAVVIIGIGEMGGVFAGGFCARTFGLSANPEHALSDAAPQIPDPL